MVRRCNNMSGNAADSPSRHITVVDVYDLASAIGKDFEHLIEQYGTDSVTILMPKVISSLEMLEAFASRNECENEEIITLRKTVDRLEAEKKEAKEIRSKFEKELEQMEDNYKSEIKELWDVVQKLQEENKKLSGALENKDQCPSAALTEADLKVMLKLQDTVEKQRDQLRAIERENEERAIEIDALQQSIDKINRINKELLRKNRAVQGQGRLLVEEKADLIAHIQAKEKYIDDLTCQLSDAERAKRDLEQSKAEETPETDRENTPRFTLAELREVLQEKNTLKARVMELEEELEQLRPTPPTPSPRGDRDEELPVQGPMPREPDEKLTPWRARRDSGVRKLFLSLFSKTSAKTSQPDLSPTFELARSAACSSRGSSVSSSVTVDPDLPSPQDAPLEPVVAYRRHEDEQSVSILDRRSLSRNGKAGELPQLDIQSSSNLDLMFGCSGPVYMEPVMSDVALSCAFVSPDVSRHCYPYQSSDTASTITACDTESDLGIGGCGTSSPSSSCLSPVASSRSDRERGDLPAIARANPTCDRAYSQHADAKSSSLVCQITGNPQSSLGPGDPESELLEIDENAFPSDRRNSSSQRRPSLLKAKVSKLFNTVVPLDKNSGPDDKTLHYDF